VEATICLTLDDNPKKFILAIKLLLQNAKFLDQNFDLPPLKNLPGKQTKTIIARGYGTKFVKFSNSPQYQFCVF
jgi:hypothetical protein